MSGAKFKMSPGGMREIERIAKAYTDKLTAAANEVIGDESVTTEPAVRTALAARLRRAGADFDTKILTNLTKMVLEKKAELGVSES